MIVCHSGTTRFPKGMLTRRAVYDSGCSTRNIRIEAGGISCEMRGHNSEVGSVESFFSTHPNSGPS